MLLRSGDLAAPGTASLPTTSGAGRCASALAPILNAQNQKTRQRASVDIEHRVNGFAQEGEGTQAVNAACGR